MCPSRRSGWTRYLAAAVAAVVVVGTLLPTVGAGARLGTPVAEGADDVDALRATHAELSGHIADLDSRRASTVEALAGAETAAGEATARNGSRSGGSAA